MNTPRPPDAAAAVGKLAGALEQTLGSLRDGTDWAALPPAGPDAALSLLQECLAVCARGQGRGVEPVRTLHHFACTGGTLISKCVGAMPNVQLLSEVDPLTDGQYKPDQPRFAPTDMPTLLRQSTRGVNEALITTLFRSELEVVYGEAVRRGQRLVLRDHAHSHYCRGTQVAERLGLRDLVAAVWPVRSVLTVRHPLDSFASLVGNGWVHFRPATIDEYCRRHLAFLQASPGVAVIRYEDFATMPHDTMQRICSELALPYFDQFPLVFSAFRLSGDSGRESGTIALRSRRPEAMKGLAQALASPAYMQLTDALGYDPEGLLAHTPGS